MVVVVVVVNDMNPGVVSGGWGLEELSPPKPLTMDNNSFKMESADDTYYTIKFAKMILRKIIKIVATRCHTVKLKCIKFDFSWGSALDPAGGA